MDGQAVGGVTRVMWRRVLVPGESRATSRLGSWESPNDHVTDVGRSLGADQRRAADQWWHLVPEPVAIA